MSGETLTREHIKEAVHVKLGLSRAESAKLVEWVFAEVSDTLARGEPVKLSSFGSFSVHEKGERKGRNPKTGEEVPIAERRVVTFRASSNLKDRVVDGE
ncbi:MAG: integration host factor subunit alpha [Sphingomonadales bacterium]